MATTGTAPRRSKESSVPLVINRSAGLRLSMIFAPKALHLLFLLMLDCNLDLDPRTPRWPPMTPDPNNDGQFWLMEADCRGRTCPPEGSLTHPAPGHALDRGQAPRKRPLRTTEPARTVPQDLICHRLRCLVKTPRTEHQQQTTTALTSRGAGATPAWAWEDKRWRRRSKPCWVCTATSCSELPSSPTESWVAGLEAFAATYTQNNGAMSASTPAASWMVKIWPAGKLSSTEPHTSTGRTAGQLMTTVRPVLLTPAGRSRSHCTAHFQALKTLHPYGPSRLTRNTPRARTLCRSDCGFSAACEQPTAAAGAAAHHVPSPPSLSFGSHSTNPVTTRSRAGPKPGTYLLVLIYSRSMVLVGGARVAPDSAPGAGPIATAMGKHRGPAQPVASASPMQSPVPEITHSIKRAYRRARLRAHNSPHQGTWYRGRWHTAASLGRLPKPTLSNPRRVREQASCWRRPVKHLRLLSWNCSGLSSPMFQELIAWCECQAELDSIVLQETHWHDTSDFHTGPWLATHTSGRSSPDGFGRCSGILFLLRKQLFQDPRILELDPGRLAMVQATSRLTRLPVSIIGLYQHVWRSGLSTAKNLELRRGIWTQLDHLLLRTPARHHLLLCGDFNSTVATEAPLTGPSTMQSATDPDGDLKALLQKRSLCVLNTWHSRPSSTFYSPTGATQIDFVITRQRAATFQAKWAYPDHNFPVGGSRLSGHYPVRAQLPLLHFSQQPSQAASREATIDLPGLQAAVHLAAPEAQLMQRCIEERLQQVDTSNLQSVHHHVNRILLAEAAKAFPKRLPADPRVSASPEYRLSARSVWDIYAQLKRPGVCTVRAILTKWRLATKFAQASKQLRQQSRLLKRQFYESQVWEAEAAATQGDQRSLYLIVRRLSPKQRQLASRLRGDDGRLLSGPEEVRLIAAYGNQTFAAHPDSHCISPLAQDIHVTDQDLRIELGKLGLAKAVPRHIAPAAVWKVCSRCISEVLGQALRRHLTQGSSGHLHGDWKDCHMVWIPKPGKAPIGVASLRPIGLSSPASKALAGSIRHHLLRQLEPLLHMLPQFAYARGRGTADALIRARAHLAAVDALIRDTQCTRFQQQAGRKHRSCVGGISLSLDLSKAFDGVPRHHIYQSMEHCAVPPEIISLVQQLHHRAQYIYYSGEHRGATITTNGIKQGCVIAPYLWNFYSLLLLFRLQKHRDTEWVRRILTLFADDIWGAWEIRQAADLAQAIHDISLVLETLESLSMTINYSKTAILLRLVGKEARQLKHEHTFMKAGKLHLRVTVHGRERGIPIKDHHEYLGTVVTYRRRHQRNMSHRLKACSTRYQGLRKLLNGSHHLSESHRIRLWQACICTSAMYAQHVISPSASSLKSLTTVLTKHLRAILRLPAHISHISTADIWKRAGLPMPGWTIQLQQQQMLDKLEHRAQQAPDITTTPAALRHLRAQVASLDAVLKDVAEGLARTPPQAAYVCCPYCQESFVTEHAMRIHCGLRHQSIPRHSTRTPTVFQPALHSKAGMPACQLCDRQFWRWAHLVQHIEKGACRRLGGQSDTLAPAPDGQEPAPIRQPPTAELGVFGEENVANQPLVTRKVLLEHLDTWERWLSIPAVRLELRNHCAL